MTVFEKSKSFNIQQVILFFWILTLLSGNTLYAQINTQKDTNSTISPFDFGLAEAGNDTVRYDILYNSHLKAVQRGVNVSYAGIDTLTIAITENAKPIPLTRNNDFNGLHLIVKNNSKSQYLFEMKDTVWQEIPVDASTVDSGDFSAFKQLSDGLFQVILEDEHPWVNIRSGYSYGAFRRDILLVKDGKAESRPVAPYSTDSTSLKVTFHATDNELKTIANLTITRDTSSTSKTYCFDILGINNLKIKNLKIETPDTKNMYADAAINIVNCTNITLEDVHIDGTYSRTNNYGYGIQMNNVWKSQFDHLSARANWGIFGTNNLSNTTLRNCNINRFDIHCYGRDVYIYNSNFNDLYNQISSFYGILLFEGCRFTNFVPVLFETSYNAYTPFDIKFKNCTFNPQPSRNYLVSTGLLDNNINPRPELAQKCWPNISISDMTVNLPNNVSKIIIFYPKGQIASNAIVDYISHVQINGLRYKYIDTVALADLVICNSIIRSRNPINYTLNKVELIPSSQDMMHQYTKKYAYPGSIAFNLRKDKNDPISISQSRLNYNVNTNSQYGIKFTNCEIGMIRYNSNVNGTKRAYNHCTLYLNNPDDARYYIDNQATYYKCTFIPCNDKMFISFTGNNNDVIIKNCKSKRKTKLFYQGRNDNAELRGFVMKGNEKYFR